MNNNLIVIVSNMARARGYVEAINDIDELNLTDKQKLIGIKRVIPKALKCIEESDKLFAKYCQQQENR